MNRLKISIDDGRSFDVAPTPGDLVRFERQYGLAITSIDEPSMEHVMFIGWSALKRLDEFEGDFEDFLDHVAAQEDMQSPPALPPG